MNAPFFFGETELLIDSKHRLILPASARKAINTEEHGEELFIVIGSNLVPWLYPDKYYAFVVAKTMPEVTPDDDLVAFAQLKYAMADRVKWDPQGRMVLPDKLLKKAEVGTEVTLLGCQDHLELWNRAAWNERREYLWNNRAEVERRAKEARKNASAVK